MDDFPSVGSVGFDWVKRHVTSLDVAPGFLRLVVPAVIFAAVPVPAAAQETNQVAEVFPLPEILVTAEQPRAPTTMVVRSVDVGDIRAWNAHTAAEALTQVPGINVQYGGSSGEARAWIRGFRDRDTLVLFDGIPIASAFEGTIDLNEISTAIVSSIKVMKAAPSVIYGTNGMSGVIDVIPGSSSDKSGFSGALELGENGRELYRASYAGGSPALNYVASGNFETADDYALSESFDSELNQPSGDRVNSDFDRSSVFLHANSDRSPLGETSFFYSASDVERGMPPEAGVEDPDYERVTKSLRQTVGLSNHFSRLPLSAKLYYNHYDGEIKTYTDASYREVDEVEEAEDYAWGGMLYSVINTHENNTLILHGSMENDVYKAEGALEDSDRAELHTYNLAIEDQYWHTEAFSIAAGAIYTWFEQDQNGDNLTALSPQIAFGYRLSESLKLHASVAQRTRFPKLRELYRRRYGNPDLKEQTAINYELGASYSHSASYESDIALFRSDLKDLIERPDRRSLYQNLDDVTIEGVEFSTGGWVDEKLFGRVSYTYVDASESLPGGRDRQLRSRPKHTTMVEARLRLPSNMLLSVNGVYVSDLYDLDENNVHTRLSSYFAAHAKIAKEFRKGVSLYLSASNLFDENFEQRLGNPREGRAFSAGLEFQL